VELKRNWKIISLIVIAVLIIGAVIILIPDPEVDPDPEPDPDPDPDPEPEEYELIINIEGEGTTEPEEGNYTYEEGEEIEITALPEAGREFERWSGDYPEGVSQEDEITVEMDSDKEITASFIFPADSAEEIEGVTEDDRSYNITGCAELQAMKFDLTGDYQLAHDINCEGTEGAYEGKGLEPLGDRDIGFSGSFEGNGHSIYNLHIDRSDEIHVGLFGGTESGGTIENIHLENAEITGAEITGSLVGINRGEMENTSSKGTLESERRAGGLVGWNHGGSVSESQSKVQVTGTGEDQSVGGLIGYNTGTVLDSHAEGNVKGEQHLFVGGLIGRNAGEISNSYSNSEVTGNRFVGGFTGENNGEILNSHAAGVITGGERTGGLIGYNDGAVHGSYANTTVEGNDYTGGLIGDNRDTVENAYSTGKLTGDGSTGGLIGRTRGGEISYTYSTTNVTVAGRDVNGLIGRIAGEDDSVSNSFSDQERTNQPGAIGVPDGTIENVEALSSEEMQDRSTYEDAGWDFEEIWRMNNYPRFQWE